MREGEALARRCGRLALAAILLFSGVAIAVQGWRSDLDWWQAPLSFYLLGDSGLFLKTAYFGLAAGLVLLGLGGRAALGRGAPAAALFVLAGLALASVALLDTDLPGAPRTDIGRWHGLAAQTAFLSVTLAMLWQSWLLRGHEDWRARFAPAFALALAAFAALWLHALWRELPRGASQRAVIVLVLAWLLLMAWWLRRTSNPSHPS
jgi:hypothetical protein